VTADAAPHRVTTMNAFTGDTLAERVTALEDANTNIIAGRMVLPEITEVRRLRVGPGDALLVKVDTQALTDQQMNQIRHRIGVILGMPDLPVLVAGTDVDVSVVARQ